MQETMIRIVFIN